MRSFRTEQRVAIAFVAVVCLLALLNWSQW
jgi:hypothetical protein